MPEGFTDSELALTMAVRDAALRRADRGRCNAAPEVVGVAVRLAAPASGRAKIANAILESIGKVIPGVGAVEEFKK